MRQTQQSNTRRAALSPKNWLISAAAIAMISGGALALEPDGEGNNVLKGPRVEQTGQPDRGGNDRAPEQRLQRAQRANEPRLTAYMRAIRTLQRADNESLRLTQDQQEQLRTVAGERREEMAAFMEAHKDEIHELRKQAGLPEQAQRGQQGDGRERAPRERTDRTTPENEMSEPPRDGQRRGPSEDGTQGNRPDRQRPDRQAMDREEATPEQQAARDKLRTLMESAPSEKGSIEKAMGVLTTEQQSHVKKTIAEGLEQARTRRASGENGGDAEQGMEQQRDGAARRGRVRGREGAERGEQGEDGNRRERRAKPSDG